MQAAAALASPVLPAREDHAGHLRRGVPVRAVPEDSHAEVLSESEEGGGRVGRAVHRLRRHLREGPALHVRVVVAIGHRARDVALDLQTTKVVRADHPVGVPLVAATRARVPKAQLDAAVIPEGIGLAFHVLCHSVAPTDLHALDGRGPGWELHLLWELHLQVLPLVPGPHRPPLLGRRHAALAPLVAAHAVELALVRDKAPVLQADAHRLHAASVAPEPGEPACARQARHHCAGEAQGLVLVLLRRKGFGLRLLGLRLQLLFLLLLLRLRRPLRRLPRRRRWCCAALQRR
mmetsp:Transcript_114471/g.272342  ORF Transcript_114471/g.272342 Transcript_114471/m.272342 type:complete len:291 (-) Transcript_114471:236-1108(-)